MIHEPLQGKEDFINLSEKFVSKRKRIIERNAPFKQSSNRVNIRCSESKGDFEARWTRRILKFRDWFDFIMSVRTSV